MELNNTESLPFLSPRIPQNIPPMSRPAICKFNSRMPSLNSRSPDTPRDCKLGTRTILNRNRSYISTRYPREATTTGMLNRCGDGLLAEKLFIINAVSLFLLNVGKRLSLDLRDIHPASLAPAFQAFLCELNALHTFNEIPGKRVILNHMLQKQFPLYFESIIIVFLIGYFRPSFIEVDRLGNVRIPHRLGRIAVMLYVAFAKSGDSRSFSAVHLQGEQVVPSYTDRP